MYIHACALVVPWLGEQAQLGAEESDWEVGIRFVLMPSTVLQGSLPGE